MHLLPRQDRLQGCLLNHGPLLLLLLLEAHGVQENSGKGNEIRGG